MNGFDLNGQTENKIFRLDCKLFPITQDYAIKTSTKNKLNNYFQLMFRFFQSKFEGNLHLLWLFSVQPEVIWPLTKYVWKSKHRHELPYT